MAKVVNLSISATEFLIMREAFLLTPNEKLLSIEENGVTTKVTTGQVTRLYEKIEKTWNSMREEKDDESSAGICS